MKSATAENIKVLIEKKCFKQSSVARKAGYSVKTFNNMLNGRKLITDIDVVKIAEALGVSPNELFGIKETQQPTA